jgi:hypothetical protein
VGGRDTLEGVTGGTGRRTLPPRKGPGSRSKRRLEREGPGVKGGGGRRSEERRWEGGGGKRRGELKGKARGQGLIGEGVMRVRWDGKTRDS